MSFFKFDEDDIFINTIEAYPKYKFYIQSGSIYIDDLPHLSGSNTDNIIGVPKGFVSLYEYNIDKESSQNIYPFIIKNGKKDCFKTIGTSSYATDYQYGGIISSSYNMSASITREYFNTATRTRVKALKNTFNHYRYLSPHYEYSPSDSSYMPWDKDSQTVNLISIPSILFGSKIKKGSVRLKYYVSGSLIGELSDYRNNGELVQVAPEGSTGSGSVAGVVLYGEGILALTGAWSLDSHTIIYDATGNSKWVHFGYGANDGNYPKPAVPTNSDTSLSASFLMEYSGTTNIQTLTMLAHANYGQLNHSTNPTFISKPSVSRNTLYSTATGSLKYLERSGKIKNVVESTFTDVEPRFDKTVYISKIGIYDEDRNLIAIAKMATPVRKTDDKQYTFKLKVDI